MKRKILASFCALIFSAMLTGCGTKAGKDISSDISSMMPNNNNSSQQNNANSAQYNSDTSSKQNNHSEGQNSDNYSSQGTNSQDVKISREKAKEIALKHANLKAEDITDYEIDLDNENGVLVYEISFDHNTHEYDYEIDANTGDIKHSNKEIKD